MRDQVFQKSTTKTKSKHGNGLTLCVPCLSSSRSQEETLNHQRPQYIRAKVNTSHHQRKVDETRTSLLKSQKQEAKKEQELQELETELQELERAWRVYEREIEERAAQRGEDVHLEEAQVGQRVG